MALFRPTGGLISLLLVLIFLSKPAHAFGAGFVSRGSSSQGVNFRHGDILNAVYFLHNAHSILVKQVYFGNWLRDFSQLLDRKTMEVVPEPILRAVVAVFAYTQFGYTTREFEVTSERLGSYRPEEHIDNPKGYEGGQYTQLRVEVHQDELLIEPSSGMKNYIANQEISRISGTSLDFIEKELVAAIACGRARDPEAYLHLGAALHTLEDFVAHSNWLELCLGMIGSEKGGVPGLAGVFPFVGEGAFVTTRRGRAPPLVTGTFGALDLYQTLLGEIDDKVSAMSLTGLQMRSADRGENIKSASKTLIGLLGKFDGGSSFDSDITKITKSATTEPADWGKLNEAPQLLWEQLEPIFRFRDKMVRWIYEHLTIKAVANAIASLSTALDKLVYLVIGIFLGPVLKDVAKAIQYQSDQLLIRDQEVRSAQGEQSIFSAHSRATDPTHSQLCKDHYDHPLNELGGKVATKITTFTIKQIIEVWQPGTTTDVKPVLASILETLHHPYNTVAESSVQSLMLAEVISWVTARQQSNPESFALLLARLDKSHMQASLDSETSRIAHSHKPAMTSTYGGPETLSRVTAHDLTTVYGPRQNAFVTRIEDNITRQFPSLDDLPILKDMLKSEPSGDTPNPIDAALSYLPGANLLKAFKDIPNDEIRAAPGMGNVLKDAVMMLRSTNTEWLDDEQKVANTLLGELELADRKEMLRLLDVGAEWKEKDREHADAPQEGESKTRRLLNKMKIRVS